MLVKRGNGSLFQKQQGKKQEDADPFTDNLYLPLYHPPPMTHVTSAGGTTSEEVCLRNLMDGN